jgi:hypothetical protein
MVEDGDLEIEGYQENVEIEICPICRKEEKLKKYFEM